MLKNLKISTALGMSFAAIFFTMIFILSISLSVLDNISRHSNDMTQLRTPTIQASTQMENGINQALAALRGWILLSDERFKIERAKAWKSIHSAKDTMDKLSLQWTNPQNVLRLQEVADMLEDFEKYQNKIEVIAEKKENIPATNLLLKHASPRAKNIIKQITLMIDLEKESNFSVDRKILFAAMADFRGTMAMSLVNIRTYLLTGDKSYKENFDDTWAQNKQHFNTLINNQNLLNTGQMHAFTILKKNRKKFTILPEKIFTLRANDNWNIANYLLKTKAAPIGSQLKAALQSMVADQHRLLEQEGMTIQNSINGFIKLLIMLIFFAVFFLLAIAIYIIKRITRPINQAVNFSKQIAQGDFTSKTNTASTFYETKQLLIALHKMANDLDKMIRKIQESEARIKSIVDNAVDAIITINDSGTIQTFNSAAVSMFGHTAHEVIGQSVSVLMPNPYKDKHNAYISHYMNTGKKKIIGIERETIAQRKNGSTFPVEIAVSEINLKGHDKFFTGIIRDLSEKKLKERELQISIEAANKANKAKSEFLSSMSHELRTPMNAIIGFSELLIFNTNDPLSKSQTKFVTEVINAGKHLLELINEVLDLSTIESGHAEICMESINTKEIIGQVCSLIQPQATQQAIIVERKALDNINGFNIKADHIKLKQVLLNLASNAVKYNSEHGTLTFSCHKTENKKIRLNVSDTGEGVSEELFPSLFKPFNRLDKTNSNIQGTGIGLTISRQLVELMGGEIGVFKNSDKGLTFWLEFDEISS